MALNIHAFPFAIFAVLAVSVCLDVSAALGGGNVGGWKPIKDPNDPSVVEIGQFAVNEYNKEAKAHLQYQSVLSGKTQVVAGMNYKLVIAAKDGTAANKYEALVWDKAWEKFRNLTSFRKLN